jgi:hypothetical protein
MEVNGELHALAALASEKDTTQPLNTDMNEHQRNNHMKASNNLNFFLSTAFGNNVWDMQSNLLK